MKAFIIAGTASGTGKTIVTAAILDAFRQRGLIVQPFKAGPDYIDPGYHRAIAGRPSYNLDTWMMGKENVRRTFYRAVHKSRAQVAVIEGVMGLFDGKDGFREQGSTAHIAKVLKIPVLLVVNAEKSAGSVAAIVKGFQSFRPGVDVKWVVFNRAAGERHYKMLKDALKDNKGVRVIGFLPRDPCLFVPERHLGLFMQGDLSGAEWKGFRNKLGSLAERHMDLSGLLRSVPVVRPAKKPPVRPAASCRQKDRVRIAVAKDSAFCFYYEENLDILKSFGADIACFSPIKDRSLPDKTCGVYLGGGYPEMHLKALSGNARMKDAIRNAACSGMPIYAECGGLMYLGKAIKDLSGKVFPMAGVFPWTSVMSDKDMTLGYRRVSVGHGCPFLKKGAKMRGHEYHYSKIASLPCRRIKTVFRVKPSPAYYLRGQALASQAQGYLFKKTLASYIHLHFASSPGLAKGIVSACRGSASLNE
ncbi:MAG: cobyrinate a,c-diamide synthase [Deltaproteobacteria bacterium]|nr:cobyrinate a,c-diamide synthase [Deltaproteobacteria bacterium]